jgi:hypothetical protein
MLQKGLFAEKSAMKRAKKNGASSYGKSPLVFS